MNNSSDYRYFGTLLLSLRIHIINEHNLMGMNENESFEIFVEVMGSSHHVA